MIYNNNYGNIFPCQPRLELNVNICRISMIYIKDTNMFTRTSEIYIHIYIYMYIYFLLKPCVAGDRFLLKC